MQLPQDGINVHNVSFPCEIVALMGMIKQKLYVAVYIHHIGV